ncbi:MAG TPA: DUF4139 domain-containing protein [Candidatus Cloacimonadota bacterium]|nr:DUF4139 domain-containing protein [Candidatus Cloacimonadota bacterium]
MKNKIILSILLLLIGTMLLAEDWLTIYNDDLSLVRSTFDIEIEAGRQEYNFDQITSRIQPSSVIVTSKIPGFKVAEQNYEYDLADRMAVLGKYLNKEITVYMEDGSKTSGFLKFFDHSTYGIVESKTERFIMIAADKVQTVQLVSLPPNFYVRPTLHWSLISPKSGRVPIQLSYLSGGFSWDVTYNTVWDGKKLDFNSWVTINNRSGRAFENANLKLIAGEINRVREITIRGGRSREVNFKMSADFAGGAPSFEEKAFHDFHMYTLDQKVSFANNQTKQLSLYPTMNVTAEGRYEYEVFDDAVSSIIQFKNTEENGIGVPLPKGVIKVYKQDSDGNMEFIGEDSINHTSRNEEVKIKTGKAFDIVASTLSKDHKDVSRNASESTIQITIRNNSNEEKTIDVIYQMDGNECIISSDIKPEIDTNNKATFSVKVPDNTQKIFSFRERTEY